MNQPELRRYSVENLACAACAAKIEQGLNNTEGVEEAVLDFANLTLHLKSKDIPKALGAVTRIDPQVRLSPKNNRVAGKEADGLSSGPDLGKEIAIIAVAALIVLIHLVFEEWFHRLPWAWVEYASAGIAYLLVGWKVFAGAVRTMRRGDLFDENVLMVIATLGAMAIHALSEAVGVMLFFKVGELLQNLAVAKSRRSVRGLSLIHI